MARCLPCEERFQSWLVGVGAYSGALGFIIVERGFPGGGKLKAVMVVAHVACPERTFLASRDVGLPTTCSVPRGRASGGCLLCYPTSLH